MVKIQLNWRKKNRKAAGKEAMDGSVKESEKELFEERREAVWRISSIKERNMITRGTALY